MLALLFVVWSAPEARAQQSGCADGQREGFIDRLKYPNIAGCSGGWSIPGVMVSTPGIAPYCPTVPTHDSLTPACGRGAGDDGTNPTGTGCNVADLCASGWHVCANEPEVAASSPTGCEGATRTGDPSLFFLTRQSGTGYGYCALGTSLGSQCHSLSGASGAGCLLTARTSNDLFGCGNLGAIPSPSCGVFNRFSQDVCGSLGAPWECHDKIQGLCETQVVKKASASAGGVLCCRDRTNRAPVARCQDVTVETDTTCHGCGSINAGSSDPDFDSIQCVQTPACAYTEGTHTVTLTCTDARGLSSSCTGKVRVNRMGLCTPPTEAWTQTASLAQDRLLHTAVALDSGKVLVVGGFNATVELYDPASNTWARAADALAAHRHHSLTKLRDGQVLLAGNEACPNAQQSDGEVLVADGTPCTHTQLTAELYSPETERWRAVGRMLTPRARHAAVLLGSGQVLVVGGQDSETGALLGSAELYDPATDTWSPAASLRTARRDPTATLLPDGKVLLAAGGGAQGDLASAELYDPALDTWKPTGSLGTPRRFHTATALPSGQVLVIGGGTNGASSASAELYDPATGTWTPTDAMGAGRRYHSATLMPSGRVLVAGGYSDAGGILASVELYTPATERWSPTVSLRVARYSHTATLLPDGRLLAAGGVSPRSQATSEWFGPERR